MYTIDFDNKYTDILLDDKRVITAAHLNAVCKCKTIDACRYICLTANGFVCIKNSILQNMVDLQVDQGNIKAHGNNCTGIN